MAEIIADLLKGDKIGTESDYRDSLPVNVTGVAREMFGTKGYMLQASGLVKYGNGKGIDRGGLWNERHGEHYRVSGQELIKVGAGGDSISLGIIDGLDTVSLPYSFNTQGIVANKRFYLYDSVNGLVEVIDPDLGDPIDCVWIDGYYFLTDGETIYHTNLVNETQIDSLKFSTAEFSPDPTLGVGKTPDNKVIVFNRYTTEYFRNVATANFAFTRISNRAIKSGIVGTHCKAEMNNSWYVMGGRKEESVSIHVIGVGSYSTIASREVDKIIEKYTEEQLSKSVLETRVEDGYQYLIVHLPNETLLYNAKIAKLVGNAKAWTILKSDIKGNNQWRAKHGLYEPRLGKFVYGDKIDATLGILDESVATQYDEIIECEVNTPFMYFDGVSIDELDIQIIAGHTISSDAVIFLSLTYDGVTHGTEVPISYGLPSEYDKRFIVYSLGHVDGFVSIKLRWASRSRVAFSRLKLKVG